MELQWLETIFIVLESVHIGSIMLPHPSRMFSREAWSCWNFTDIRIYMGGTKSFKKCSLLIALLSFFVAATNIYPLSVNLQTIQSKNIAILAKNKNDFNITVKCLTPSLSTYKL